MIEGTCSKKRKNTYVYISGDIEDEDEVLSWLTDENTLEIPGKIEEVNSRMLDKILEENDHVVVFFCEYIFYNWFRNMFFVLCSNWKKVLFPMVWH